MGCVSSKTLDEDGRVEIATGDYIAKQDVTIWSYSENGNLSSSTIPENSRVEVRRVNEEKSEDDKKIFFCSWSMKIQSGGRLKVDGRKDSLRNITLPTKMPRRNTRGSRGTLEI